MTLSSRTSSEPFSLPHKKDLEHIILGTSMIDSVVLNMAIEQLRDDDFYIERCRELFVIMKSMFHARIPVDLITLNSKLETANRQDLFPLLVEISDKIGAPENCEGYIELLAQEGRKRGLIIASNEISRMCYDNDTEFDSLIDESEKLIQNAIVRETGSRESSMTEVMSMTADHLHKVHTGTRYGITTGFPKLNEYLSGYEPGQVIVLAGRPSMGKTSLATATALNLAINEKIPVAIFSLETSKVQLGQRLLCQWAGINLLQLRQGWLPKDKYQLMYEAMGVIAEAPVYIEDESLLTVNQFRSKVRKLISKYGVKLAIIDYIQLMGHNERDSNTGVSKISRGLKITSKDLKIPIMALSQLSRANEKRTKKSMRPVLSDLRDSGAIEQDADVVMFTHREHVYNKEHSENDAEIIIAKQKNGPIDTVHLHYVPSCSMFKNEEPEVEKW